MSKNREEYIKVLAKQQKQIEILKTDKEICRILSFFNVHQNELKNSSNSKGVLVYKYGLKEYLELNTKTLLEGRDIDNQEYKFLENFEKFQNSAYEKSEADEVRKRIQGFIFKKYQTQIEQNIDVDLNNQIDRLNKIAKKAQEYQQKEMYEKQENEKKKFNLFKNVLDQFKIEEGQTRIMYSIQSKMVEYDIEKTKNEKKKAEKVTWLESWKSHILDVLGITKNREAYFFKDESSIYNAIGKAVYESKNEHWIYLIMLDCLLFDMYAALNNDEKVRLSCNSDYLMDVFCSKQIYITKEKIKQLRKTNKKYFNEFNNVVEKTIINTAVTIIITVASGGAAFAFAPTIAVGLVGSSFALSGAALTNASLALIGGGALAVGGFGMAGGTAIIAGGGALIGSIASGSSAVVMSLLSNQVFTLKSCAMLLTFCSEILKFDEKHRSEIQEIKKMLADNLKVYNEIAESLQSKLEQLKEAKIEKKKLKKDIENIKKSIGYIKKTDKILSKEINKAYGV